jgi:hypothetical protein
MLAAMLGEHAEWSRSPTLERWVAEARRASGGAGVAAGDGARVLDAFLVAEGLVAGLASAAVERGRREPRS